MNFFSSEIKLFGNSYYAETRLLKSLSSYYVGILSVE